MNRDVQNVKNIQNKNAQAREQYEKNKPLLKETVVNEKIEDAEYQQENTERNEELKENSQTEK